jgi:hypothetical protein
MDKIVGNYNKGYEVYFGEERGRGRGGGFFFKVVLYCCCVFLFWLVFYNGWCLFLLSCVYFGFFG